ncbi:hypothetical protein [Candidatus Cyanaurora vandensis]|uniref:hypothetical protein n=1 Tax=Candidatus Cyanaurora vandensis TaxID=2714958 RepID=UPI00257BD2F7|nr:hypothetical protein [Candidatus Cyanaurora vandensis]
MVLAIRFVLGLVLALPTGAAPLYQAGSERVPFVLQTHARPGLAADHLYWGMLQAEFLTYADQQQWERRKGSFSLGGSGLYTPEGQLVFTQDATVRAYFRQGRLVGLLVLPTAPLDPLTLTQWGRAWFPDDRIILAYQSEANGGSQRVLQAILGEIPSEGQGDVLKLLLPFRTIQLGGP